MKLIPSLLVLIGVCVLAAPSKGSRNKWDAIVALDSAITPKGVSTRPAHDNSNVANVAGRSDYRRTAMQAPPTTGGGGGSGTRIDFPELQLIISTELDIAPGKERELAAALSDRSRFRAVVSAFLDAWRQPGLAHATEPLVGLHYIAEQIRAGKLATSDIWRFNVTPIPAQPDKLSGRIKPKVPNSVLTRVSSSVFEIRMVIPIDKLEIPERERATLRTQLLQMGVDNAVFLKAVDAVKVVLGKGDYPALYPSAVAILDTAFPSGR